MIFLSWSREHSKLILRNYFPLPVFTKRFIVNVWHRRCLNKTWVLYMPEFSIYWGSEYTRFWICFWFWLYQGSGYTTALNMPGLNRVLNTLNYAYYECAQISLNGFCFTLAYCNSLSKGIIDRFFGKRKFDFFV